MKLKIFSFFSGAGFLDLGFERSGYEIDFVNEYSSNFLEAYKYARQQMKYSAPKWGYYNGDINDFLKGEKRKWINEKVRESQKDGLVGFIGGPPCPDFSIAGKNKGINGAHGILTTSYKKVIIDNEPDFFLFENVKGLWSTQKHRVEYEKLKRSFRRKGYVLVDKLVNSLDYGVPQDRERIILFGIKYELLSENKALANRIIKQQFEWGMKEKFSYEKRKMCAWPSTSHFVEGQQNLMPTGIIPELSVEYWFQKNDVLHHCNSEDYFIPHAIQKFETIQEGDVSRKSFKRLHRWRYSPTVAYGNNEVHLHPYYARRISVAEALAIQSLPKEYVICKSLSKSEMFKTVANGVPFLMSKGIAESIYRFIDLYAKK